MGLGEDSIEPARVWKEHTLEDGSEWAEDYLTNACRESTGPLMEYF